MQKNFILSLILLFSLVAKSQNDIVDELVNEQKPKREYVAYTFKTTRVISGHSIETVKKNALDFRISHRFGDIATPQAGHTLAGFYAISDVMFSLEYGILDDLTVGVMGTKGASGNNAFKELYTGFVKYRVLKQTRDFKFPMTITLFGNASVSGMKNDPFNSSLLLKNEKVAHRFSYTLQSMFAVKATDWLSVQLSPTFVWRNYVPYNDKNGLFFLGLSARAKVSKRTAILFEYYLPITANHATYREYFPMVRGLKNAGYYPALNLGMEFETGGHVFHINLTNSEGLVENDFLPYTTKNWAQGQFRLGFTISRIFQLGKNGGRSSWDEKDSKSKKKKS